MALLTMEGTSPPLLDSTLGSTKITTATSRLSRSLLIADQSSISGSHLSLFATQWLWRKCVHIIFVEHLPTIDCIHFYVEYGICVMQWVLVFAYMYQKCIDFITIVCLHAASSGGYGSLGSVPLVDPNGCRVTPITPQQKWSIWGSSGTARISLGVRSPHQPSPPPTSLTPTLVSNIQLLYSNIHYNTNKTTIPLPRPTATALDYYSTDSNVYTHPSQTHPSKSTSTPPQNTAHTTYSTATHTQSPPSAP